MGRKRTIDAGGGARLLAALAENGNNKAAAARDAGVSTSAAKRFLKGVPEAVAHVVTTQQQVVEAVGVSLWDTRAALEENERRCLELLTVATALDPTSPKSVTARTAVLREIRAHIEGGMGWKKLLIDVEQVRAFQQAVNDAIHEADPATAARVRAKLRERRAENLTLEWAGS